MGSEIRVHEAANMFPMMSDQELEDLKKSILSQGLMDPVSVLSDGQLIDGRNRVRACSEIGIEVQKVVVETDDPVAFVWARNGARRHLKPSQLAAIAAKMLPVLKAQAKERQREGARAGGMATHGKVRQQSAEPSTHGRARSKASDLFGVNHRYISQAEMIQREAPDVFAGLEQGTIPDAR